MIEAKNGSKNMGLSKEELKKIGKGFLIACAGAFITIASEQISQVDFGVWTPAVMAFWSAAVNAARMYFPDTRK